MCFTGYRPEKLNRVFGMADTFSFFKDIDGRDLAVCVDYYPHAVLRGGKIVAPERQIPGGKFK